MHLISAVVTKCMWLKDRVTIWVNAKHYNAIACCFFFFFCGVWLSVPFTSSDSKVWIISCFITIAHIVFLRNQVRGLWLLQFCFLVICSCFHTNTVLVLALGLFSGQWTLVKSDQSSQGWHPYLKASLDAQHIFLKPYDFVKCFYKLSLCQLVCLF